MFDNRPIGLFDSGVGGLSILKELKKFLPNENYIFVADQKNIPYGKKTEKELQKICENITNFLKKQDIKLMVIACNTATCYTLDHLRSKFKIPIVGTVPAVKTASSQTKNKKIAVLSTPATAKSTYLKKLISDFAKDYSVLNLACPNLESSIEKSNKKSIDKKLKNYLKFAEDFGADTIVLGCTHYPLIKDQITKQAKGVSIIDSGQAISKRVRFLLAKKRQFAKNKIKDSYFTTDNPRLFQKTASFYLNEEISAKLINISK